LSSGGNLSKIFHIEPVWTDVHGDRRPGQTLLQRQCALGGHEPGAKLGHRGFV